MRFAANDSHRLFSITTGTLSTDNGIRIAELTRLTILLTILHSGGPIVTGNLGAINPILDPLINKAGDFAAKAHEGQKRKYTNEPYVAHVAAVARIVADAGGDDAMIAAAYLHDTIEDCGVTYDQLVKEFSADVANLVLEVTDVYTPEAYPHLDRKARKELEAKRLGTISTRAKAIKLADIADNSATIEARDPAFAKVYLPEKQAMRAALGT